MGLAYSWREKIYYRFNLSLNKYVKYFYKLIYNFLTLYVKSPERFKFDRRALTLNSILKDKKIIRLSLLLLAYIYYIVTIFVPYYFDFPGLNSKLASCPA